MNAINWSTEQILTLAPGASSVKSAQELATPRKWLSLGTDGRAAWGQCQGSAQEPYQTRIDLEGPAFKCSCPSHKIPCKHSLGLFLLLASQPGAFSERTPPVWVSEWLLKRSQGAAESTKPKGKAGVAGDAQERREAQIRRAAKREERVLEGLDHLELWLYDLMRQGLGSLQAKPPSFWDAPAARLVDAQAPGLARRVRELTSIPASGEGWQERLLEEVARLHLALTGYRRQEELSPEARSDLRALIGWTQDQDALLEQDGVLDNWLVVGRRVREEDPVAPGRRATVKTQRTWLLGEHSRKVASVLAFAAPGEVLDGSLVPGAALEAELVYFPGAYPLRALVKHRAPASGGFDSFPAYSDLSEVGAAYAAALAANPWLELFPLALESAIPYPVGEIWGVRDAEGRFMRLAHGFMSPWRLLALSGGKPVAVFGEWDGVGLWPLSMVADGRWVNLAAPGGER